MEASTCAAISFPEHFGSRPKPNIFSSGSELSSSSDTLELLMVRTSSSELFLSNTENKPVPLSFFIFIFYSKQYMAGVANDHFAWRLQGFKS